MARTPAVQQVDELPEADRLEGFLHPRHTRILFGHDAAERGLADAFAGGRMHHGWLLTGREGIGKATLAYRLARYVLSAPQDREAAGHTLEIPAGSPAARQVSALSHPGFLLLRRPYDVRAKRFAASIPIDDVRRLKSFLGLTEGEHAWRVVIVDTADELNPNAANALLKSLEEPPARALFVLISSEPGNLLPTIRSRCRRLDLEPLATGPLQQAVHAALAASDAKQPAGEQWQQLERLAAGSVRRALQLAVSGGLELYTRIEAIFAGLPKLDWTAVHALSDELAAGAQEQRFEAFFELFLDLLARLVRVRATGAGEAPELAMAERLIREGRLPAWAALWEELLRQKNDALLLNLDRKALIVGAFGQLQAATGS